jgi:hypothetical protein
MWQQSVYQVYFYFGFVVFLLKFILSGHFSKSLIYLTVFIIYDQLVSNGV